MINFFTIVLDGEPWIERHYPVFSSLDMDWRWTVVEGVAGNRNCTSWCNALRPRLSVDGTTEYLRMLANLDSRVLHISSPCWPDGKAFMCNAALAMMTRADLLWQVDADELWTKTQIQEVVDLMRRNIWANCADFYCRYFVGPDRYVQVQPNSYGNHTAYEWRRVWRYFPGLRFESHEPPLLRGVPRKPIPHDVTRNVGAVFDHMAYATRAQMEFKAVYYAGHKNPNADLWRNCVGGWERLQAVTEFPVKLKDFFPWVDGKAQVVRA